MKSKAWTAAGIALVALAVALPVEGQAQDAEITAGRSYQGELAESDAVDSGKQFYDNWRLRGRAGERLSIVLESDAFDAQLEATLPDGTVLTNDDNHWIAETTNSRIDLVMPADGMVNVHARSFRPAQTGAYTIRLTPTAALAAATSEGSQPSAIRLGEEVRGELGESDGESQSSRHLDRYSFSGTRGQRIDLRAASGDFDTMLTLTGPANYSVRNDDDATAQGETLDSRLLATLPADGSYTIGVTSYSRGSTGAYTLATGFNRDGVADTEIVDGQATQVALGRTLTGSLDKGDETLSSGEYLERYRFAGRRGQPVTIDYSSDDFDTYLILRTPSGEQQDVDDTGDSLNSRFERVLEEDGDYTIVATSYTPGATGAFQLALSEGTTRIPANPTPRRVFAISVGIADYGGNTSDLTNTDSDAAKLFQKLDELGVLRSESVLMTNQQATLPEFRRAFARVAAQAGPEDIFLFFYSGHGSQIDDPDDSGELDGRDETLVFADGEELTDDDLATMFRGVRANTTLLVLDSCFSGGFERDLITRPGMMGLFSSEEDLTSLVASEFSAGGYLARFFSDAIAGQADDNGDRNITAGELVSYLRYRFRAQCNGRNCIEAETGDAQRNHQELVVQRGSIEVDDILMVLPRQFGLMGGAR